MIFAWLHTTRKIPALRCCGSCRRYCRPVWGNSVSKVQSPMSKVSVCLVSGGMDSCVSAAIANQENEALAFLHISYGQKTETRERRAFNDIADNYGVEKRLDIPIEHLARIGGS